MEAWVSIPLLIIMVVLLLPIAIAHSWLTKTPKFLSVFAPYEKRLNIHEGRETWEESCIGVPEQAVLLFSLYAAYGEIDIEGFDLFFMEHIGAIAPEARDGFKEIGMPEVADVIQRAMDKVGRPFPLDIERRRQILGEDEFLIDFEAEEDAFRELFGITNIMFGPSRLLRAKADAYAEKA